MGNKHSNLNNDINDKIVEPKCLLLYQGSNQWKIKYYKNTSRDDIIDTIRDVANIEPSIKFFLLDEDGEVVAISSSIPNNTKLFIQIIEPLPKPAKLEKNLKYNCVQWKWDPSTRTCNSHICKDNNLSVGQDENHGWGHTWSNHIFDKNDGIQVWSILFNPIRCCIYFSLSDVDYYNMDEGKVAAIYQIDTFNKAFREGKGFSVENEKPLELIFVLNMDKLTLHIFNKQNPEKPCLLIRNLPSKVRPFATLKHVVFITVTGFGSELIQKHDLNLDATPEITMQALTYKEENEDKDKNKDKDDDNGGDDDNNDNDNNNNNNNGK